MIRIEISEAAFVAVASSLPKRTGLREERTGGGYAVWLEISVVNQLAAMRKPGDSYPAVILRLFADKKTKPGNR